ncbi:Hypothetical protein, putative [Bodo saltans]|uniref:Uncharacterized protein n=1 Tax=Bodo saltans TaxID=75058 RepID=A0A0S4KFH8_BODSA|nr:Hypothetical protein, putative [Bodo saltans]|eukprot:CUI14403.1 Hypothetical protein, putative [Bodo saltans]
MSWEVVKGFCRRRTQQIRENFQGAHKTEDHEFDAMLSRAESVVGAAERMTLRLSAVHTDLLDFIKQYDLLHNDLASPSISELDLQGIDKKIELATQDYKIKFAPLEASISKCLEELRRYQSEAHQMEFVVDDRKTKMLEYDFFKNKLVSLRANPPTDTTRIPRNESREAEWQRAFEESSGQARKLFQHLIKNGGELIASGASILAVDVSKFFGEVSKTQRVLFLGSRLADEASSAMSSVQQTAAATIQQATSSAAAAVSVAAITVQAAGTGGSRRYFSSDDPFRTN